MRALIAAAVMSALLSACGLFGGGPARVPAPLVEFKATMQPRQIWSAEVGKSGLYSLAPAVVGDAVFAAGVDGQVMKLDAATGRIVWRADAGITISAGVAAGQDIVVVGGPDGDVVALGAADGKQRWKVKVPGELFGEPVVAGDIVVLRSSDARLFALDGANGARAWTLQRPLPPLVLRADAGMVVAGDELLASFPGGRMLAVVLKTGTVRFDAPIATPKGTTELERIADVVGTPALQDGDACVAAFQGRIGCVNARNGTAVWGRDFSAPVGVAADARYVFGVDDRSTVHAFLRGTGVSMWSNDKLKDRVLSAPVSWGRAVVVGDLQGHVHLIGREEGGFLARIATDGSPIRVAPRLLDLGATTALLVQTSAGGIHAYRAEP